MDLDGPVILSLVPSSSSTASLNKLFHNQRPLSFCTNYDKKDVKENFWLTKQEEEMYSQLFVVTIKANPSLQDYVINSQSQDDFLE